MGMLSSQCIEKLEIIGHGSFGRVFKCRDLRTGEFVAVKEIDLDGGGDDCFEELRAEISTLMTCDHPNIIRYRGSYVPNNLTHRSNEIGSPLSNRLCIVMDYCECGSLRQLLDHYGPLPEPLLAETAESILKALEYLHRQGISHRDLKGANVLVDKEGKVKLGDFGVAFQHEWNSEDDNKIVGSPYWMAPEVLNPSAKCHDASKADIWSFGITLIELLHGRPPLHYLSPRAAMAAIPRTSPPRLESDDPGASKPLRELIHACLHDDPKKRPSSSQLLKSFKSYFKQQKYNVIPGALARLGKISNDEGKPKFDNDKRSKQPATKSETIYSQWDFDLSTLATDTIDSEPPTIQRDSQIKVDSELLGEIELVKTLQQIVKEEPPMQIAEAPNEKIAKPLKFRKLQSSQQSKISGWEDKDTAILPIPCPNDAPDLSRSS